MRVRLIAFCAFTVLGCTPTEGNVFGLRDGGVCAGRPCDGCCDSNGVCQPGQDRSACGAGGLACTSCGGGEICSTGACVCPGFAPPELPSCCQGCPPDAGQAQCQANGCFGGYWCNAEAQPICDCVSAPPPICDAGGLDAGS